MYHTAPIAFRSGSRRGGFIAARRALRYTRPSHTAWIIWGIHMLSPRLVRLRSLPYVAESRKVGHEQLSSTRSAIQEISSRNVVSGFRLFCDVRPGRGAAVSPAPWAVHFGRPRDPDPVSSGPGRPAPAQDGWCRAVPHERRPRRPGPPSSPNTRPGPPTSAVTLLWQVPRWTRWIG